MVPPLPPRPGENPYAWRRHLERRVPRVERLFAFGGGVPGRRWWLWRGVVVALGLGLALAFALIPLRAHLALGPTSRVVEAPVVRVSTSTDDSGKSYQPHMRIGDREVAVEQAGVGARPWVGQVMRVSYAEVGPFVFAVPAGVDMTGVDLTTGALVLGLVGATVLLARQVRGVVPNEVMERELEELHAATWR